jgi:membrane-associated phospholipid phosphatase
MIAMGGIVGLIIGLIFRLNADMLFYLALAIIVSGVVATSRLILKAHNPKEIYSGFLLGLELVCLFVLYL